MSLHREDLANGISESIASWDEDTVHDVLTALLREAFSANNTYDGSHFEHAEFEDEALDRFKTIFEDIQAQKTNAANARALDEMFNDTAQSISKLSAYVSGQRVNELA